MTVKLSEDERLDELYRNGYRIIQNKKYFCFGIDAVLLSDFARAGRRDRTLDLGTGTGIIPLLMEAKTEAQALVGLELQEACAEMARRSVALNHLESKIRIITGDIREASSLFPRSSFQVITCNPPYMEHQHGIQNLSKEKAIARHEITCSLEDVLRETSRLLCFHGRFYMIHKPFRMAEIVSKCKKYDLEPKRIRFVHPYVNKEPTMMLIEAVRGGRERIKVEPPLIVYDAPGQYTREIYEIYGEEWREAVEKG